MFTLINSCVNPPSHGNNVKVDNIAITENDSCYTPPSIPMMINSIEQRTDYLITHYWDNFNFNDSTLLSNSAYVEQAWSIYIMTLNRIPYDRATEGLKATMDKASVNEYGLEVFYQVSEKYLYHPNSPMRNDEYFIPILEYIVSSQHIDDIMKIRPIKLLKLAKLNRVGEKANDFKYSLESGISGSLYTMNADYTLLFFNDPDCEDCKRVKEIIASSQLLGKLTGMNGTAESAKQLAILSIYPDDNVQLWRNTEYPEILMNAYDSESAIYAQGLYDLKALPTLYLLDTDKGVILKDTSIETVINWLSYKYSNN